MTAPLNLTMPINELQTYNPLCYNDINAIIEKCNRFQVSIIDKVGVQFRISIILLTILIAFRLYTTYARPKFAESEFFKKHIDYRIDLAIAVTTICMIGLMFI